MKNYTNSEIRSLIERFEARKLPKTEWTHEAHLVVAIWCCSNHGFDAALPLVRMRITAHNESVGTPNTDTEGYHETITRFWLWIASKFLEGREVESMETSCNAFINSSLSSSNHPLAYYSREHLFSVQARHAWVEPDVQALPETLSS